MEIHYLIFLFSNKKMKRLYRSRTDRKITGLLGGLGQYFSIDPALIRLLFIIFSFMVAVIPALILYFIAAIFIPLEPHRIKTEYRRLYRSSKNRVIAGVCGGLGEFLKMDPVIIRLIFIVLAFITAIVPMIIFYIIAWIIIPTTCPQ